MLTPAQIQTLKAWVAASTDPAIVDARTRGATYDLSLLLSAVASPVVKAWRVDVDAQALDEGADYSAYDGVQAGKRDAWAMFLQYAPRDMAKNRNRKTVTDVWGAATAGSNAEDILNGCVENAKVVEVVIGGSVASTGTVSALKRDFVGSVTQTDCVEILKA